MSLYSGRAALVMGFFDAISGYDDWAVLKGWDSIPNITGDLDLVVEPAAVAKVGAAAWEFLLDRRGENSVIIRCDHIRGVPRFLARLPKYGYADELFEIDLATVVPVRGFRAVTFQRIKPYVVIDQNLAFPRTTPAANEALHFLFKGVGWYRVSQTPPSPDALEVLEYLIGSPAKLLSRAPRGKVSWSVAAASLWLTFKAARDPSYLLGRMAFRMARSRCPFDPRRGAAARQAGTPELLAGLARASGHDVVS